MKFAFAGTPQFAAWVLSDLCDLGRRPVVVLSQPTRPRGRGLRPVPSPAALKAADLGVPCMEVFDINAPEVLRELQGAGVSALVVASFGQMLGACLLESLLCLNIHASLLPAYRGAAPIERALAAGEERTGITVMRITKELDQGPIALQTAVSINLRDDAGSLARILALLGAVGMHQVLTGLEDGTVSWREQEGPSSYAAKLTSADCVLRVGAGARVVHNQIRSLSPRVGARAVLGGVGVKIWRTWPYGEDGLDPVPPVAGAVAGVPGRLCVADDRLFLGCAQGVIEVLEVQPNHRKRMSAAEFLRGYGHRLAADPTAAAPPDCGSCGDV
ncbi:MAG: formyltransferase family protein [Thermoleophilia bacterium]|nr:formyltransferase family protein [Thermoleophilia bacterium]